MWYPPPKRTHTYQWFYFSVWLNALCYHCVLFWLKDVFKHRDMSTKISPDQIFQVLLNSNSEETNWIDERWSMKKRIMHALYAFLCSMVGVQKAKSQKFNKTLGLKEHSKLPVSGRHSFLLGVFYRYHAFVLFSLKTENTNHIHFQSHIYFSQVCWRCDCKYFMKR